MILLLSLVACGEPIVFDTPIPVDDTFPRVPASGPARDRLDAAADWSEDHGGLALLVIEGDAVVYERYREGFDPATPVHLFSGTKSFACPLAMQAVADGRITLDEPVVDTLPELAAGPEVRVRHLLDFTSGISQRFAALSLDGMVVDQRIEDKYAFATALPAEWDAGTRFHYGSSHLMVFGALLEQKLGGSPLDALTEDVLDPIGLRVAGWIHDPSGNPMLPYGAWTTANEWAKYGVLLRDDGVWEGARVLPEGAVAACTTGSDANPAYGLTFWLNAPLGDDAHMGGIQTLSEDGPAIWPDGPTDLFAAAGANDQRLYVVPSRDLVIVRLGDGHRRFRDDALLSRLLAD